MNQPTGNHPQPEALIDFGLGKLDAEKSSAIEEHLSECEDCCETLLNLQDDTFTGLVRSLPEPNRNSSDGVTEGAVDRDESRNAPTMLVSREESGENSDLAEELRNHPRYRIVEQIGQGGMGNVYRAEHKLMNRPVALKVINSQLVNHPQAVERFRREVQAAARLTHPNIVTAFDAEQAGDAHFLVMEFVKGRELASIVKERGPRPVSEACDCIRQAAEGLQHAHEHKMVHRDIKPHNLMLSPNGQVRILDFGLAGFASETALIETESNDDVSAQHLTTIGSVMGTPDYISPEQARDAHNADIRSDIYSLGCTLYFLLTGKPPFPAESVADKLKAHAENEPPAVQAMRVDVPDELAEVIRRMMNKDPAQRFQTPQDVADALARFVDNHRSLRARNDSNRAVGGGSRRGRWFAAFAGLAAFFIGLAGIISVVTDRGTLVIESVDENVDIIISRVENDSPDVFKVKIVDRVTGSQVIRLPSGRYHLMLDDREESDANVAGNVFQFSQEQFELSRGDKVIVRITSKPPQITEDRSQQVAEELPRQIVGHSSRVRNLAFSPDGTLLLSSSENGQLSLHEVASGLQLRDFTGHNKLIRSVSFSADGKRILSAGWDNTIRLWDVATGLPLVVIQDKSGLLHTAALNPEGDQILSCSHVETAGVIRLWDVKTGELLKEFEGVTFQPFEVVYSPTGEQALSGAHDGVMRLWDVTTGKVVREFRGHRDWVRTVAFSKDGRLAVSGSKDNTVRVWDVEKGELLRTLTGHTNLVETAIFTPDGRRILSAALDGSVRLWDASTGEELAGFASPNPGICVAISPDGRTAASGGADNLIRVWQMAELSPIGESRDTEATNKTADGADREQIKNAAQESAQKWLKLLDAGEYGKCWDEMSSSTKDKLNGEDVIEGLKRQFKPKGKVLSRSFLSVEDRRFGIPESHMSLVYETKFENGDKLSERLHLLMIFDTDGQWRVGAHGLGPIRLPNNSAGEPVKR